MSKYILFLSLGIIVPEISPIVEMTAKCPHLRSCRLFEEVSGIVLGCDWEISRRLWWWNKGEIFLQYYSSGDFSYRRNDGRVLRTQRLPSFRRSVWLCMMAATEKSPDVCSDLKMWDFLLRYYCSGDLSYRRNDGRMRCLPSGITARSLKFCVRSSFPKSASARRKWLSDFL